MTRSAIALGLSALLINPAAGILRAQPQSRTLGASNTTPASGDTLGYWQQRVHYRIVATLDETAERVRSTGELDYLNRSPDTLRELWFHQYLNAFRPGSQWSADDVHEGRVRFQQLADPDHGFERFTAQPIVDGIAVVPTYPYAPDSTVVRLPLPRPLLPGDSVRVRFAWDARPSTLPRRQGRRGRSWDLAQWYPKVAVYDRGGWQPNSLRPAGEFYGEFGTYDVTLVVRDDQVLMASGVPVEGDPGWERARRWGTVRLGAQAYGTLPPAQPVSPPPGHRVVRFHARDVHHFAWTASPDYRYEGGSYIRNVAPRPHFPVWDTVGVHVLHRPGDDTTWGRGQAVGRTIAALRWLESIFGPYAYPQMGNVHRLDGGGTEFPMLMMNGSASAGLILHEGGHIYSYGILANNEWNAGWMDEGLTSYQTSWAQGLTAQERAARRAADPPRTIPIGYRDQATTIAAADNMHLAQHRLELLRRTEPIGTKAHEFSEFGIYNSMIYDRGEMMYGQLRDAIGDTAFRSFLHDYYHRWALKHVDERAMRTSAERAHGRDLGWFFSQWVHHTGLTDYSLHDVGIAHGADGRWTTRATVERRGEYRHPMPVGVRTASGWTIARIDAQRDVQTISITTAERPDSVRLDPLHTTTDWDRRNDVATLVPWARVRHVFDWPFLEQSDREESVAAWTPMAWYSEPFGLTAGVRVRSSYLSQVDRVELGAVVASRAADSRLPIDSTAPGSPGYSRVQFWGRVENPYLPWMSRPLMGHRVGLALLDGILRADWLRTWDRSPFLFARGPRMSVSLGATGAFTFDPNGIPEQWSDSDLLEVNGSVSGRLPIGRLAGDELRGRIGAVAGLAEGGVSASGKSNSGYAKIEAEAVRSAFVVDSLTLLTVRGFGAVATNSPLQRAVYASTRDPMETFDNHWWRPRGAPLKQRGINYLPLGGAGLRGYDAGVALNRVLAVNGELSRRVYRVPRSLGTIALWVGAFGDAALAAPSVTTTMSGSLLADAGVGAALRGRFFDREVRLRLDLPLWVHQPALAGGSGLSYRKGDIALRWVVSTD